MKKQSEIQQATEAYRLAEKEVSYAEKEFHLANRPEADRAAYVKAVQRKKNALEAKELAAKALTEARNKGFQQQKEHLFKQNKAAEPLYVKFKEGEKAHIRARQESKKLEAEVNAKFAELTTLRDADENAHNFKNTKGIILSEELDIKKAEIRELHKKLLSQRALETECLRTCKHYQSLLSTELRAIREPKAREVVHLLRKAKGVLSLLEREQNFSGKLLGSFGGSNALTGNLETLISQLERGAK